MRSPVNHSMMSVSWMASPTIGPILLRMVGVQAAGMLRRDDSATILPIRPSSIACLAMR